MRHGCITIVNALLLQTNMILHCGRLRKRFNVGVRDNQPDKIPEVSYCEMNRGMGSGGASVAIVLY